MGHTLLGGGSPLNKFREIEQRLASANGFQKFYIDAEHGNDENDGKSDINAFRSFSALADVCETHAKVSVYLAGNADCVVSESMLVSGVDLNISNVDGSQARLVFDGGIIEAPNSLINIQSPTVMRGSVHAVRTRALGMVIIANSVLTIEADSTAQAVVHSNYGSNQVFLHGHSFVSNAGNLPIVKNGLDAHTYVTSVSTTLSNMTEIL